MIGVTLINKNKLLTRRLIVLLNKWIERKETTLSAHKKLVLAHFAKASPLLVTPFSAQS